MRYFEFVQYCGLAQCLHLSNFSKHLSNVCACHGCCRGCHCRVRQLHVDGTDKGVDFRHCCHIRSFFFGIQILDLFADFFFCRFAFERPNFQRLMGDIKAGKVNCIVVKDLSRLGRNYIETGRLIEQVFPLLGVRFIAILDHYDSAEKNDASDWLILPFKNLINDAFARDISVKIRSQLDVKRKNGKFIGSFACYGYQKDPKDANRLIIDPYAGEIVRSIFRMKLSGCSSVRIAEKLKDKHVKP